MPPAELPTKSKGAQLPLWRVLQDWMAAMGVIAGEHRFAERRLEHVAKWTPTQAEMTALGELVNRKAGCRIMWLGLSAPATRLPAYAW